jgi:hypothetical protein
VCYLSWRSYLVLGSATAVAMAAEAECYSPRLLLSSQGISATLFGLQLNEKQPEQVGSEKQSELDSW